MRAATVEGNPKTPLPMMEFTTSATRLQRPMARMRSGRGVLAVESSITAGLYHKPTMLGQLVATGTPLRRGGAGLRPGWDGPRACPERSRMGGCPHVVGGDLGTKRECTIGCFEKFSGYR